MHVSPVAMWYRLCDVNVLFFLPLLVTHTLPLPYRGLVAGLPKHEHANARHLRFEIYNKSSTHTKQGLENKSGVQRNFPLLKINFITATHSRNNQSLIQFMVDCTRFDTTKQCDTYWQHTACEVVRHKLTYHTQTVARAHVAHTNSHRQL